MSFDQVIFELGGQDVTMGRLAIALLVWAAWTGLAFLAAARGSRRLLWPGTSGGHTVGILLNVFRIKMVLIGLILALAIVGVRVLPLVGVLLALAAVAAVSFRSTSEQVWAGLLILWERPFSLGERILVGEYEGEVERVGLRATTLRSEERMAIHVPNAYLTRHAIHNRSKTEGGFGLRVPVEVMAHCDSGEVISALRKSAERNNRVRSSPSPKAFMMGFTARGVQYELRAWVDAYSDALWARNELCRAIQSEFQRAGITMVSEKTSARPAAAGGFSRPRPTSDRDHESRGRDREAPREARDTRDTREAREARPERSRSDRDREPSRNRERNFETPREDRAERPRSERPSRDRQSSRSDGSSRRQSRGSEAYSPAAATFTPDVMDVAAPAPMEEAPMELELEVATMPSEPEMTDTRSMDPVGSAYSEASRDDFAEREYVPAAEVAEGPEIHEVSEGPHAEESPEPEAPAPKFGRSKRRVPRR